MGELPIPKKLLQQGVRDMVRISERACPGANTCACVLNVAPKPGRRTGTSFVNADVTQC